MKILFAVNDKKMLNEVIKEYQTNYKEIISFKNMSYYTAVIKELHKNKTYDRIVISEDLEPIGNNSDVADKYLIEKLEKIKNETIREDGTEIPIILISTGRRTKYDPILTKMFNSGIYNILLEPERNASDICSLINRVCSKEEVLNYYQINEKEITNKNNNINEDNQNVIEESNERKSNKKIFAFIIGSILGYAIIKLIL